LRDEEQDLSEDSSSKKNVERLCIDDETGLYDSKTDSFRADVLGARNSLHVMNEAKPFALVATRRIFGYQWKAC
jgi:hypothetical protein